MTDEELERLMNAWVPQKPKVGQSVDTLLLRLKMYSDDRKEGMIAAETDRCWWLADMDSDPCDEWLAIEMEPGKLYPILGRIWVPGFLTSDPHDRCDKWAIGRKA